MATTSLIMNPLNCELLLAAARPLQHSMNRPASQARKSPIGLIHHLPPRTGRGSAMPLVREQSLDCLSTAIEDRKAEALQNRGWCYSCAIGNAQRTSEKGTHLVEWVICFAMLYVSKFLFSIDLSVDDTYNHLLCYHSHEVWKRLYAPRLHFRIPTPLPLHDV
ncbi:hypothetical protein GHT06_009562 [Daphnia sinensis]|uniref:Uncharacterized protein n=1 Tax=Daphnia sinensis TaxID=1820382 RepID=A0AAD5Q389_9CRUS|nr:hypothetical protein GHT06_009562 [Daphnia sinensis]